ncbi:MAG: ABC transporter permease [Gemmatimonadota bacterium]
MTEAPGWVQAAVRRLLPEEVAAEVLADLAAGAARRHGTEERGRGRRLWYLGQLLHPDMLRLAWATRGAGQGAGPETRRSGGRWMRGVASDVRMALRGLRPALGLALLCLAAGMAVNGAAFSVVHAILWSPLPFADGERLVLVQAGQEASPGVARTLSWAELEDVRRAPGVEATAAFTQRSFTVRAGGGAERVSGAAVTPGTFALLGVEPALGRLFHAAEGAEPGFEGAVILSHRLWRSAFGGGADVLERSLTVNDRPLRVVGVLPPGVAFPAVQDLWLPLGTDVAGDPDRRYLNVLARTVPGQEPSALAAHLTAAVRAAAPRGAADLMDPVVTVAPLRDAFTPAAVRRFTPLLLPAVGFVLLIACVNVANLLLARTLGRRRELAIRAALGAGRARLARLVAVEAAVLAVAAAVLALPLAWLSVRAVALRLPPGLPYWVAPRFHLPAVLFVLATGAVAALLAAVLPLLHVLRTPHRGALGTRGQGAARGTLAVGRALVAAEVALAFVLLVGALAAGTGFLARLGTELGFQPERLASARVVMSGDLYDVVPARLRFLTAATAALDARPDVVASAFTTAMPAEDLGAPRVLRAADGTDRPVRLVGVSAGSFQALGAPLLEGRDFTSAEVADTAAGVAVVSRALAQALWPAGSALDATIHVEGMGPLRVVGVAPDIRYGAVNEEISDGALIHVPWARLPSRGAALLVRGRAAAPVAAVAAAVGAGDPDQAAYDVVSVAERVRRGAAHERFFTAAGGQFGALGLLLALAGVYAVVAGEVRRRLHELAVRMAVGASPASVARGVLGRTLITAAMGVVVGLLAALALTPVLASAVFGLRVPGAGPLMVLAVALLVSVALAAAPVARRAGSHDLVRLLGRGDG